MKRVICFVSAIFLCILAYAGVREYKLRVVKTYPHNTEAYTQGLFFWNGCLYESTGQYGTSTLARVDLVSGKSLQRVKFNRKYFGEGSCVVDGKLYVLTWTNKVAFVYDAVTLKYEKTLAYPREGWGLAIVGGVKAEKKPVGIPESAVMVASDGTANLFYLDRDLRTLKTVPVTYNGRPLRLLNELEWIDGRVWANVYTTDMIVIINPVTGAVEGRVDCSDLFPQSKRSPQMDVLNGIAQSEDGSVYLTGKLWPTLYKVELIQR